MRILMLSQFFPPLLGGEESLVAHLTAHLVTRGHDVSVATLGTDDLPEFDTWYGARVYRIRGITQKLGWLHKDGIKRQAPPLPDLQLVWELRRIVARERPQIVHAHNWIVHSFLPLKAWSGAKLVLSLHDYSFVCPTKKLLYQGQYDNPCSGPGLRKCLSCSTRHYGAGKAVPTVLSKQLMGVAERKLVDLFLPVSEATAAGNQLSRLGVRYDVLPNFIPELEMEPGDEMKQYLDCLPDEPFLMYAGAFAKYKGVDTLLEAYAGLVDGPPLVFVGYRTTEYPMNADSLPPNVSVLLDWPQEAVLHAWKRCSVAIVPSRCAETFGIVALEAMHAGKPVIASRIGGLPEVVDNGETGILVEPGNPDMLREALSQLIEDPDMANRLGQAGKRRAIEKFGDAAIVAQLETHYARLVEGREANTKISPEQVDSGAQRAGGT